MAVKCVRPLRVGTRRTLRSGSTPAFVYHSGSLSEHADILPCLLNLGRTHSQWLASPLYSCPDPPGSPFRGRGPPVQWSADLGSRSRCPLTSPGDGLASSHAMHPPFTCLLPLQPGFPRAPSRWSRHGCIKGLAFGLWCCSAIRSSPRLLARERYGYTS